MDDFRNMAVTTLHGLLQLSAQSDEVLRAETNHFFSGATIMNMNRQVGRAVVARMHLPPLIRPPYSTFWSLESRKVTELPA